VGGAAKGRIILFFIMLVEKCRKVESALCLRATAGLIGSLFGTKISLLAL
jgi:hypothetical protein